MHEIEDNIYVLVLMGTIGILALVIASILLYIRHQQKILRQYEKMRKLELCHQKELLSASIQSQENERKRIGQDLHDDVGAALSGLRLAIDMYDPENQTAQSYSRHVGFCKTMIDKIIDDVRHISHHLSPASLNFKGLQAALESYFSLFNQSGKIRINFDNQVRESILESINIHTSTAIYCVIEELLTNTVKHSGATIVTITFREEDEELLINYSDNGVGLSAVPSGPKRGIGFYSMESRLSMIDATYQVKPAIPQGFAMAIQCPLFE
jgi:signal transduction histidine kinase